MDEIPAALGLTGGQVAELLATAGRAPSLHDTRPWRFGVRPDVLELHADPGRRLPVTDPDDRALRIACGAALFTLRLALRARGIRPTATLLPDPTRPGLIAEVRHGGTRPAGPDQHRLLDAVARRRTDRHPSTDLPVTRQEQYALRRAALDEGAWLHVVEAPRQRAAVRQLAVRAHRTQIADPAFLAELRDRTGTTPDRVDGVPVTVGGPRPAPQDRRVLRDHGDPAAPDRVPGEDFERDPLIAVLTSHLGGPRAEIQTGGALQHVLLTAAVHGLSASPLPQIVEVPGSRDELRRLLGATRPPQVVLRLGRGRPVPATPRRPVNGMISHEYPSTIRGTARAGVVPGPPPDGATPVPRNG